MAVHMQNGLMCPHCTVSHWQKTIDSLEQLGTDTNKECPKIWYIGAQICCLHSIL